MEEITKKKRIRGGHRGYCTQLLEQITVEADVSNLKEMEIQLKEQLAIMQELDREIMELAAERDEETCLNEAKEAGQFRRKINGGLLKIEEKLSHENQLEGKSSRRTSTVSVNSVESVDSIKSGSSSSPLNRVRAKLPKLELKKFSGRLVDWPEFWDSFKSAVDENPELSEVDKFSYLKHYLDEPARKVISGFTLTSANYKTAVDLLKRRFSRPTEIKRAHINELLNSSPVFSERNVVKLRELYDTIETHHRALEGLGISETSYSEIVVPVLLDKLPEGLKLNMMRGSQNHLEWTMEDLLDAFSRELDLREQQASYVDFRANGNQSFCKKDKPDMKSRPYGKTPVATTSALLTKGDGLVGRKGCIFCNGEDHKEKDCQVVSDVGDRKGRVFKQGRCLLCLGKGHRAFQCRSKHLCHVCKQRHHVALCNGKVAVISNLDQDVGSKPLINAPLYNSPATTSLLGNLEHGVRAVLQTAQVVVTGVSRNMKARVLFDSGSHKTYVTRQVVEHLRLKPIREERLRIRTFGSPEAKAKLSGVVKLKLESLDRSNVVFIEAFVVDDISKVHNEHLELVKYDYDHLKGLWFSDVSRDEEELEVDILIGVDYLHELQQGETKRGEPGEPVAVKTKFGWVASGPLKGKPLSSNDCLHVNVNLCNQRPTSLHLQDLDRNVGKLWELEAVGISEDSDVYEDFLEDIEFTGQRYSVKLPWKVGHKTLPTNYDLSFSRLKGQMKKLRQYPAILRGYDDIIKDQLEKGIIEQVSDLEKGEKTTYLPHQAVVREDAETTKIRVVYDASAKEGKHGTSLNDCLHVGPPLAPLLVDVLLRFRENKVGIIADIEKAFLNVEVDSKDRDCLRFLWVEDVNLPNPSVRVFRFNRVVFGVNCSPFLLNAVLKFHISKYENIDSKFAKKLGQSFYVDDLVTGVKDANEGEELFVKAKDHMGKAGFNLRKWKTNDPTLANVFAREEISLPEKIEEETYAKEILGNESSQGRTKVLGVTWDMTRDTFEIDLSKGLEVIENLVITKRILLSIIARIFDPLGVVSPIVVSLKILFQELCCLKLGWDDEIPATYKEKVKGIVDHWNELGTISLPRCLYNKNVGEIKSCSLHGFGDASNTAYCAAIYLVYETDQSIFSRLVCAKSRVAPLKSLTIPKLELMSARMLSSLMNAVHQALCQQVNIDECKYWLDSKTALYWINNQGQWKQFVQHRVNEILKLTKKENWGHCPGLCNPADIGSRGISSSQLNKNRLWWEGPKWLTLGWESWPKNFTLVDSKEIAGERKKVVNVMTTVAEPQIGLSKVLNINKYNSLGKLLRITSYVCRFVGNLKASRQERILDVISAKEILEAEKRWIIETQNGMKRAHKFDSLKSQLGIIDEGGILICKGRLENADMDPGAKFPILIPRDDKFSDLVILDCHRNVGHMGLKATLAELRSRFWVPKGRQYVKKVLKTCRICKLIQGKPYASPPESMLPEFRVQDVPPFTNVGVDFAGPLFYKKEASVMNKCYLVLYTCCTSRAVHLDVVTDLSGTTFVNSLRRFTARRGTPALINSDNAKTFKFAAKFLDSLAKDSIISSFFQERRTTWRFNLERSPWWGGYYERMIGTVKKCLKKVIGNARLTLDELQTVLSEIESLVNSRPITYLYDEIGHQPLTPSHLLHGRKLCFLAENVKTPFESEENATQFKKRFAYLIKKLDHFTSRWKKEYLVDLREFHFGRSAEKSQIGEGDVVLIKEDNVKRNQWKMGVVQNLIIGKDGVIRGATVRTCNKGKKDVLNRPLQRLIPLELQENVVKAVCKEGMKSDKEEKEVGERLCENVDVPQHRTQRAAAKDSIWKTRLLLDSS